MEILINGKYHKCSQAVGEEIIWINSKAETAKRLAVKLQDLQDDMNTSIRAYQSQIDNLIEKIKNL